jgi:hypothetical protein
MISLCNAVQTFSTNNTSIKKTLSSYERKTLVSYKIKDVNRNEIMRRTAKYRWQDYKTNKDILSKLKINPVVKIIQNYINKWVQHVQ